MPDAVPWDDIAVPDTDFNVRQVSEKAAVPCFWGRDASGACLFIVELEGNHAVQYRRNAITARGIDVDLRGEGRGRQRLVLTLGQQVDRDLFAGFCHTLVSVLEQATDSASSLAVALTHIRRWKNFLSGHNQRLSSEEVRGLFAELTFLLDLIDRQPATDAIEAWHGSERSHQDFVFGNTAVEIKSLSGAERSTVRVSSEDQLESLNDRLFLRVYRLSHLENAKGARSLNEVVATVQGKLNDAEASEAFDRKLATCGYVPLPDYDTPCFVVSNVHSYRVEGGFPRLMRSQLPPGIANVSYDIKLEAIASHECDGAVVLGVDDGTGR
ncbi:MAG: PD-(D/E)XK motif protein [Candidatus Accumulibacter sp.]|jgi:hypothetical protein|nr:PD-(D/E)XK motif protein [Accumulibacter sp.]